MTVRGHSGSRKDSHRNISSSFVIFTLLVGVLAKHPQCILDRFPDQPPIGIIAFLGAGFEGIDKALGHEQIDLPGFLLKLGAHRLEAGEIIFGQISGIDEVRGAFNPSLALVSAVADRRRRTGTQTKPQTKEPERRVAGIAASYRSLAIGIHGPAA